MVIRWIDTIAYRHSANRLFLSLGWISKDDRSGGMASVWQIKMRPHFFERLVQVPMSLNTKCVSVFFLNILHSYVQPKRLLPTSSL